METFGFAWFFFSAVVGYVASQRNRSGIGWFFISVLLTPVLGAILVLILRKLPGPLMLDGELVTPETHVRCPDCRGYVRADSSVCRHCGCKLKPQPLQPAA